MLIVETRNFILKRGGSLVFLVVVVVLRGHP
jgi:hypothetical protein